MSIHTHTQTRAHTAPTQVPNPPHARASPAPTRAHPRAHTRAHAQADIQVNECVHVRANAVRPHSHSDRRVAGLVLRRGAVPQRFGASRIARTLPSKIPPSLRGSRVGYERGLCPKVQAGNAESQTRTTGGNGVRIYTCGPVAPKDTDDETSVEQAGAKDATTLAGGMDAGSQARR